MKVIFFANTDWYLFNFRLGLARYLKDKGEEVVFISPPGEYGCQIQAAGFRWLALPMDRCSLNIVRKIKLLKKFFRFIRSNNG